MKRKKKRRPTPAQENKEAADFLQFAHDLGWKPIGRDHPGEEHIFANAAGERRSLHFILDKYEAALADGYQTPNKEFLRLAAQEVSKKFPDNWGFLLIAAPTGENVRTTYTANIPREDAVKLLKELLFHWGEEENWMKHTS